jgi:uncharacterized phage-like protein YoqJ
MTELFPIAPKFLGATGHRPNKLGDCTGLTEFAKHQMRDYIGPVISGMAQGWDTAWALAALDLGLQLTAAVPFPGQDDGWRPGDRALYRHILSRCVLVKIIKPMYEVGVYQRRNEWMVDHSFKMVALWNGTRGGTANCIRYAERRKVPVVNLWDEYISNR